MVDSESHLASSQYLRTTPPHTQSGRNDSKQPQQELVHKQMEQIPIRSSAVIVYFIQGEKVIEAETHSTRCTDELAWRPIAHKQQLISAHVDAALAIHIPGSHELQWRIPRRNTFRSVRYTKR